MTGDNTGMPGKDYFQMLARYNQWANRLLFSAGADLSAPDWHKDRGGAFPSLHHTLCHLYVGDRLWLSRFLQQDHPGFTLDAVPFDDFDGLWQARQQCDRDILAFADALDDETLSRSFTYTDSRGKQHRQVKGYLLAYFFNHQSHHRGQAHVMLHQETGTSLPMDFVYYLIENKQNIDE